MALRDPINDAGQESEKTPIAVVALVTSAGGLEALSAVLGSLPEDFGAAVVVAQHLGGHGSRLVEILARRTALPVRWARDGARPEAGCVSVCPPRSVLEVLPDGTCSVRPTERAGTERSLDTLLTSLGDSLASAALAVVLTGMGDDAAAGAVALRDAGGVVIAQSEETSEHPSMPQAAVRTGAVNLVLPLHEIGSTLVDVVEGRPLPRPESEAEAIRAVFGEDGTIAELARGIDWAATPLGAVSEWLEAQRIVTRMAMRSSHGVTLFLGDDYQVIINEVGMPLVGGRHEEIFAQPFTVAFPDAVGAMLGMLDRARAGEHVLHEATLVPFVRHGRLEDRWYDLSFTPVSAGDGTVLGVQQTFLDRSDEVVSRRRLETINRLASLAASHRAEMMTVALDVLSEAPDVPFAIAYELDPARSVATLTAASGVDAGSGMASHQLRLTPGALWPLQRAVEEGEVVLDDVDVRFRGQLVSDEQLLSEHAVLLPLRDDGGDAGVIGVLVVGIHPRLPLDDRYREFVRLVGATVGAKANEAQARRRERQRLERLAELDQAKTEFFSNVSHEFRTPLTLMLGPLEGLLEHAEELSAEHRSDLEVMHRNARRLLRLVGSMLDFSQVEAGRLRAQFAPGDLTARTREIVAQFDDAAARAGLVLETHLEALASSVWVDGEMWEKIVSNLLSNAIKFTFEGRVEVSLRALPKHAELVVSDTGVGIPEEELPHVFKRFHRVRDVRARTVEGAGIGLALVDELVRRHHGRTRIASAVGEGTTVTVWIPRGRRAGVRTALEAPSGPPQLARTMAEEAMQWGESQDALALHDDEATRRSLPAHTPGARIVVADDHPDMREYLTRLLAPHWTVDGVADGAEALARVRADPPDLVLADVMMPGLDGFGLLRALREDDRLRSTPVILVTARAGEEAAIEGLLAGADDYIVKPFSARELVARVGGQLALARTRRRTEELNALLVRFSDAARGLTDPAAVAATACEMLLAQLGADRAYWSEIDWQAREWVTAGEARTARMPTITGRYPLDAWEPGTSILLAGQPYLTEDIQADPRLDEQLKDACAELEMAANLALPILADGRARCVLAVDQREPRTWTPEEVALVQGVAVRCWGEVERLRAANALRSSERRQAFLLGLSDTLRPLRDAAEIRASAARLLGERLGADRVFFSEMIADAWVIDDIFESGLSPLPPGPYPAETYGRWTMDALARGEVVVVDATADDDRLRPAERQALHDIGVAAVAGVPLIRQGEVVAVLSVHSGRPRGWTGEELGLMRETADRTWPAVERAHAEAALQVTRAALAHRDPLREMVSAEGVGVLAWDTASGTLLDADDDFLAMSGYTRAQVDAGEITWRRLTAEEDVAASERELGRAARTGSIGPYRKDLVRADGSRRPMLYAGAAMSDRTVIEYCIDASGSSQTA